MGLMDRTLTLHCNVCGGITVKTWGWLRDHPPFFQCPNGHEVTLDYTGPSQFAQAARAVDQREKELREAYERLVRTGE